MMTENLFWKDSMNTSDLVEALVSDSLLTKITQFNTDYIDSFLSTDDVYGLDSQGNLVLQPTDICRPDLRITSSPSDTGGLGASMTDNSLSISATFSADASGGYDMHPYDYVAYELAPTGAQLYHIMPLGHNGPLWPTSPYSVYEANLSEVNKAVLKASGSETQVAVFTNIANPLGSLLVEGTHY
jgi:hypothetical protein